jgi:hypothetical protein
MIAAITERVERGAALLDERRPGWWQLIDLDALDIRSTCNCVAGQLGALGGDEDPYLKTMRDLGIHLGEPERGYGFDAYQVFRGGGEYEALTEAWRGLILHRRELAGVTR